MAKILSSRAKLIHPDKLNRGDKVAIISLSDGVLGGELCCSRNQAIGKPITRGVWANI